MDTEKQDHVKHPSSSRRPTILELLGSFVFGFGALWITFAGLNLAVEQTIESRFTALVGASSLVAVIGGFVIVLAMRPGLLTRDGRDKHKKNDGKGMHADKIMIIASLIVIALMAAYIYFSEVVGVNG